MLRENIYINIYLRKVRSELATLFCDSGGGNESRAGGAVPMFLTQTWGGLNEGQSADVPLTVRRVRASSGQGAALFGLSVSGASSFSISTRKSGSDGVKKKKKKRSVF